MLFRIFTSIGLLLLFNSNFFSQTCVFEKDSVFFPETKKTIQAEVLNTIIKNNYNVQFVNSGNKQFLKIIVHDDLGFGLTGSLLLKSGSKQMFFKSVKLYSIDKNSGYFILDLYPNYLVTLKEYGLSSLYFNNKTEFSIPKLYSDDIKSHAACFYTLIEKH